MNKHLCCIYHCTKIKFNVYSNNCIYYGDIIGQGMMDTRFLGGRCWLDFDSCWPSHHLWVKDQLTRWNLLLRSIILLFTQIKLCIALVSMNFKKIFKLWLKFIQHILWRKILHKLHFLLIIIIKKRKSIFTPVSVISLTRGSLNP